MNNNLILKGRRGNISIAVLVLLTLAVCIAIMLMMHFMNTKSLIIGDGLFARHATIEKEKIDFYGQEALEDSFSQCYYEAMNHGKGKLEFQDCIKINFKDNFLGLIGDAKQTEVLKNEVENGNFNVESFYGDFGEGVKIILPENTFRSILAIKDKKRIIIFSSIELKQNLAVFYRVNSTAYTSFSNIGLPSFSRIDEIKGICGIKEKESRLNCLRNEMKNFEVFESEGKDWNEFRLKSRNKYYYTSGLREMEFKISF